MKRPYIRIPTVEDWDELAYTSLFEAKALATTLGVCPRQLQRIMHERLGSAPKAWLRRRRMEMAGVMILRTRGIKSVAFDLGFKQVSHFSRAFKAFYGVTATDFRLRKSEQMAQPQARPLGESNRTAPPRDTGAKSIW